MGAAEPKVVATMRSARSGQSDLGDKIKVLHYLQLPMELRWQRERERTYRKQRTCRFSAWRAIEFGCGEMRAVPLSTILKYSIDFSQEPGQLSKLTSLNILHTDRAELSNNLDHVIQH